MKEFIHVEIMSNICWDTHGTYRIQWGVGMFFLTENKLKLFCSSQISSGGEIDGVALEELGQRLEVHRVLLPWDWHLLPPDDHDHDEDDEDDNDLPDEKIPHALNARCSNRCNLEIENYDAGVSREVPGNVSVSKFRKSHFWVRGMFAPQRSYPSTPKDIDIDKA